MNFYVIYPDETEIGNSFESQEVVKELLEQYDGTRKIDRISYNPSIVLGAGSMETKVFQGTFEGKRKVAVKRIMAEFWSKADREQANLLKADDHENVVRYYATERCSHYCYIALELCEATLEQFIELDHPKRYINANVDGMQILRDALYGIDYLHGLENSIVHRDIKPKNVLIYIPKGASDPRGKIADLGLSKLLKPHRQTFTMSTNSGTMGWMAPEIIKETMKKIEGDKAKSTASLKVDIFCSGLLLYYVKSNGKHPFDGEENDDDAQLIRNFNIKKGKHNLKDLDQLDDGIFRNLIEKMISADPKKRPSMKACLNHPVFWKPKRVLEFFRKASDYLKEAPDVPQSVKTAIEEKGTVFTSDNWISEMDPIMQKDLKENKQSRYNGEKVEQILKAIRNYSHHFNKLSPEVRGTLTYVRGTQESFEKGFVGYFLDKFPSLLHHTFIALEPCKSDDLLSEFYDTHYSFA